MLREATSETYGPRVYLLSYKFPIYFILQSLLFNLYHKNTKNIYLIIIISIRSHSRKWPWRDWQPLYRVGCEVLICLCRCVGLARRISPTGLIPWFSKTEGNTYTTLLHHPFLFKGKPTQCSRGSRVQTEWNFRERDFRNKRDLEDLEWTSSNQRGGHEAGRRAQEAGAPPPSWAPRGSPDRLLSPIYVNIP